MEAIRSEKKVTWRIRLILQPSWLRFLVWALLLTVVWGGLTSFQTRAETESTILSAIVFGAAVAGYFTVSTQGIHRGALAAVSGLDQAGRSQAIDAVLRGAVPADPEVRRRRSGSAGCVFATSPPINSNDKKGGSRRSIY